MILTYSITNDTLNGAVAFQKLTNEIRALGITIALEGISDSGDVLSIEFRDNITTGDEALVDAAVAAHDGNPGLDDPQKTLFVSPDGTPVGGLNTSDRVQVEVTGTLSDGQIKVSGDDMTSGFLENKVVSADNKISVTTINPGADEDLQIQLQSGNINTADLNNDAAFITSGQAPVQPGDIADFETSTQLDARDVANRDRANHTGTQLASTISDFNTAVQAAETTTSISLASNILAYTDEDGVVTNIDLSLYLDDTNLARIVTGSLDPITGIVTFTRDDLTTFTIDMSALLDNQNASEVPFTPTGNTASTDVQAAIVEIQTEVDANTLKVSADGSIDTHSDVDTTTDPPANGEALVWDGSNWTPGTVAGSGYTIFGIWAEENGGLSNNNRQWSFGNGATGNINIVLPIEAELFAVSFDAEVGGSSSMLVLRNDATVFTTKTFSTKDFETLGAPITFSAGDCVGFRTGIEAAAVTDARVCAWFRILATPASSSVLNDLLDVSTVGVTAGQTIAYNGSNFVPTNLFSGDYNDLVNAPTLGTAADNDETDFATAAQGLLAASAVQPGDNVSTLTNDAGYVNAAGAAAAAPVQPADIADFETTTQLNARDVNNRNRANHTGTQLASTISDFTSAVQAAETTTSLSFSAGTNILSFTDEDGTVTNIDLSLYLDDTNLARIVTGSLDSGTGIATFTRDDATTFTVDFSALNDQAAINTAISTHETSITNHDDIDTSGVSTDDVLKYNGTNWVPSNIPVGFKDFIRATTPLMNQTTAFQPYLTLTTNVPETGNYKIAVNYEWSLNTTGSDFRAQVQIDNTTTIYNQREEPQDSGGAGVVVSVIGGGTANTGTDQRRTEDALDIVNLTAGAHTIDLDFANSVANTEATIYRAIITIERWS